MPDDLPDTFETAPKYSPLPSQQAVETARALLFSFTGTNSPVSLLRAFPSYPFNPDSSAIRGRIEGADVDLDGEDSVIATVASLSVKSAANVWSMLKPGFVQWDLAVAEAEGKGKGKKRQPAKPKRESDEEEEVPPSPVSEGAWPVLEWLISVFEKDAEMTEKEGKRERVKFVPWPVSPGVTFVLNTPDGVFYSLPFSAPAAHHPGFPVERASMGRGCYSRHRIILSFSANQTTQKQWGQAALAGARQSSDPVLSEEPLLITVLQQVDQFDIHDAL